MSEKCGWCGEGAGAVHKIYSNFPSHLKVNTIPLCYECHESAHNGEIARGELWDVSVVRVARKIERYGLPNE